MIIVTVLDGTDFDMAAEMVLGRGLRIGRVLEEFRVFECEGNIALLDGIPGITARLSGAFRGF